MKKNNFKNISTKDLFVMYLDIDKSDDDFKKIVRDELFERNLYISKIIAKKYVNKGVEYDDLFQVATIGLLKAIEKFDINLGYEFTSFASPTINGEIKRYFRDKSWTIRVTRNMQELSKKIVNATDELYKELQRKPLISDIADYLSCSEEQIIEAIEVNELYKPHSLNIFYSSNSSDKELELIELIGSDDPEYELIENKDLIEKVLDELDELEKSIIVDRYYNYLSQHEIAKKLGISQMSVSRFEKKILKKLKRKYEAKFMAI